MLKIFVSLGVILLLLVVNELLWRMHKLSDELTRKIVHVSVAVFVAFWPFYMSYGQIQLISVAFLAVVLLSRYLHIFRGILHVKRKTYGDIFFPLSIFILATLNTNEYIFAIALLLIGLSDGIAALIGEKFGKDNQYKVFNQTKSVVGTTAFMLVSWAILVAFKSINPYGIPGLTWVSVLILPPVLALVENISVYGSDDLTVPLVLLVLLKWF